MSSASLPQLSMTARGCTTWSILWRRSSSGIWVYLTLAGRRVAAAARVGCLRSLCGLQLSATDCCSGSRWSMTTLARIVLRKCSSRWIGYMGPGRRSEWGRSNRLTRVSWSSSGRNLSSLTMSSWQRSKSIACEKSWRLLRACRKAKLGASSKTWGIKGRYRTS